MGWLRMRERSVEGWWSPDQPRFWWSLIGIGAALRLIGALVTPISVDTYLHATYVQNFIDGGSFALDWGPNRNPIYPLASDPDGVGSEIGIRYLVWHLWLMGWILLFGRSSTVLHISGPFMSLVALTTIWVFTSRRYGRDVALRLTAIAALHPFLIASSAMARQEEFLVILMLCSCWALLKGTDQVVAKRIPWAWLLGAPLTVAYGYTKGTGQTLVLMTMVAGLIWVGLVHMAPAVRRWISDRPYASFSLLMGGVWAMMLIDAARNPSTGWAMSESLAQPGRFALAFVLCLAFYTFVWGLFGLMLWPWRSVVTERIARGGLTLNQLHLMLLITAPFAVTTLINASFWTYEGSVLEWSVLKTAIVYVDNGRYLSLLLIPLHWFIAEIETEDRSDEVPSPPRTAPLASAWATLGRGRPQILTLCIAVMLPISGLAAVGMVLHPDHDHEIVSKVIATELEDEEEFLLVTQSLASMSRLYLYHSQVDPDGDRNLTGHWRSMMGPWQDELNGTLQLEHAGNLSNVTLIVLAPEILIETENLTGWVELEHEDLPIGWRVLRPPELVDDRRMDDERAAAEPTT